MKVLTLSGTGAPTYNTQTSAYDPSPAEIREALAVIQSEWSEDERLRRERGQLGAHADRAIPQKKAKRSKSRDTSDIEFITVGLTAKGKSYLRQVNA